MVKAEALTAYKCTISYMLRNNPLIESQSERIKAGLPPEYTFTDFIKDYIDVSSNLAIGQNTDRAILLSSENATNEQINDDVQRWYLNPRAGKQGKPITVIKTSTKKSYNFNADSAALYDHNIFAYEKAVDIVMIFHRQNGSGCKSVFLETANKILKTKGLKLSMDLCTSLTDDKSTAIPTKITLQYTKTTLSSDIAENYKGGKRKQQIVRDLGFNLEVKDNANIFKIFRNMQLNKIDQTTAFAQIKAELPESESYNDAEIHLRIGKRAKTVKWNEFEDLIGNYEITEKLNARLRQGEKYIPALTKLSDEYYNSIIKSEEIDNDK